MRIHSTAVIDSGAEIHPSVKVGPFVVVAEGVTIGADSELMASCHIGGATHMGARNVVFPYAILGCDPADKKYAGEPSHLTIGNDNVFRESSSIHRGTAVGGGTTRIGHRNLFMAHTHVAHDSTVGDDVVMANYSGVSGHVHIADKATLGFRVCVHQHCRVGQSAMLGGGSSVLQDVPPFALVQGDPARLLGVNRIGMQRQGYTDADIKLVQQIYREIMRPARGRIDKLQAIAALGEDRPLVQIMLDAMRHTPRGIVRPPERRGHASA